MSEPLQIFESTGTDWTGTTGLSLVAALLFGLAFAYFLRLPTRPNNRAQRQLGSTLSLVALLLSLGAAYFSWFTGGRNVPVRVYADRLETAFGTVKKRDIDRIRFAGEKERSLLTGKEEKGTGMIMIEVRGRKRIMIAEANYDTERIFRYLQEWKSGRGVE